ncbi:hypothetical protein Tco_0434349 [Tanacetum coccineum]
MPCSLRRAFDNPSCVWSIRYPLSTHRVLVTPNAYLPDAWSSRHRYSSLTFSSSSSPYQLQEPLNKHLFGSFLLGLWDILNKMIWVTHLKSLSIAFTILVITASLERLFVILRLSHESTSSLKELLEVSNRNGVFFIFTSGSRTHSTIIRFFSYLKARYFLSLHTLALTIQIFLIISSRELKVPR